MVYGGLRFSIWVVFVLCLVCFSVGFDPIDKYYVNCGSSSDVTVGNTIYVADKSASKFLSTPQDILADSNLNSITPSEDSQLYRTARIFTGPSKYTFSISQNGRHWIRLYFYPFVYQNYDMKSASFSVFAQTTALASDFSPKNVTVKEFSVNVTSGDLVITFSPSSNSFAYVNALEVVSVPDSLIVDDASLFNPSGAFNGLVNQALETIARVNMGGPFVSLENDTLGRTWVSDRSFLLRPNLATNASKISAVKYPEGGPTSDIAPQTVYGTCTKMDSRSDPNSNFNVTWGFSVDPGFQYLIRLHFCDIVSTAANQLLFNVYIDSFLVAQDLELSAKSDGQLATAYYMDLVTTSFDKSNLTLSIGPSSRSAYPDALLNGLEIMKMNNSRGSLAGAPILPTFPGSKKNLGVIVGVSVGVPLALVMIGLLFFMHRRRKQERLRHSRTWVPISINGGTTMGSKYSNGTTVSIGSNLSYRIPFIAVQEATNNFDESWLSPQVSEFNHVDASPSVAQFETSSADDLSGVSMSRVFSQLVKSEGR
ncbi:unnamed protein product [Fraxinus pennsylvanica]|uniref:Malectin-like domain-containing protein n=1 Tax=Fraxinus pennsylvanica TaxID=56036 RepID=A0AAD1Z2K3_9LAMI|nr:unnamed protein product [Fraxinus pennsylvanica]